MDAMTYLAGHGLHVERHADRIRVYPAGRITDDLRQFIRDHKADLLSAKVAKCSKCWRVTFSNGHTLTMINPRGLTYAEALRQTEWRWSGCKLEPMP